jgi:hypothetical protein
LTPDSMTVRLHLYRIRVLKVLVDLPERVEVVSAICHAWCVARSGASSRPRSTTRRVRIRDVPRGAQRATLIWLRRRFCCTNCGERHTETHPGIKGKMTARLARAIVTDARHLSITEIRRRYGFAWHTVMTLCASGRNIWPSTAARNGAGSSSSTRLL